MAHIMEYPHAMVHRGPHPAAATNGVTTLVRLWGERLKTRRELRNEILQQPDSVLADFGWSRHDALREARKPFWRD
jgi:uncharacterized protein YjiS (DUF1127 family)